MRSEGRDICAYMAAATGPAPAMVSAEAPDRCPACQASSLRIVDGMRIPTNMLRGSLPAPASRPTAITTTPPNPTEHVRLIRSSLPSSDVRLALGCSRRLAQSCGPISIAWHGAPAEDHVLSMRSLEVPHARDDATLRVRGEAPADLRRLRRDRSHRRRAGPLQRLARRTSLCRSSRRVYVEGRF